jgi:hypothetical protein
VAVAGNIGCQSRGGDRDRDRDRGRRACGAPEAVSGLCPKAVNGLCPKPWTVTAAGRSRFRAGGACTDIRRGRRTVTAAGRSRFRAGGACTDIREAGARSRPQAVSRSRSREGANFEESCLSAAAPLY